MLEQADADIKQWIRSVIDGVETRLDAPGKGQDQEAVCAYLMDIVHAAEISTPQRFCLRLHYLITTSAPNPETAHALLGRLIVAASDEARFEAELEPIGVELWRAFGVPPQPAFRLAYPLVLERSQKRAPPVRSAQVKFSSLLPVNGILLGPEGRPLANCRLELRHFHRKTVTNRQGRFRLGSVPDSPPPLEFTILIPGLERAVQYAHPGHDGTEITIHLADLEV